MLGCCGAPADWSGRSQLFSEIQADFLAQWRDMGSSKLIVACSSCQVAFSGCLPTEKIVSLWEVLDEAGLPDNAQFKPSAPMSIHDPCAARHEIRVQKSVRSLIQKLGRLVGCEA